MLDIKKMVDLTATTFFELTWPYISLFLAINVLT